jgi:hypothetical protein
MSPARRAGADFKKSCSARKFPERMLGVARAFNIQSGAKRRRGAQARRCAKAPRR